MQKHRVLPVSPTHWFPNTAVIHSQVLSLGHIGQHSECHHWRHLMLEYFSVLWTCWTAIWKWYSKLISIVAHFSFNKLNLVSAVQFWFLLCFKSRCYSYLKLDGGGFESTWHTTKDSSPLVTPTALIGLGILEHLRKKYYIHWKQKMLLNVTFDNQRDHIALFR